jgi:hypothetical protein
LEFLCAVEGPAVELQDPVAYPQPGVVGRAAGGHAGDQKTWRRVAWIQGCRFIARDHEAKKTRPHPAEIGQLSGDSLCQRRGDRLTEPLLRQTELAPAQVDSHHLAVKVD